MLKHSRVSNSFSTLVSNAQLKVTPAGNVGVKILTPIVPLHVKGDALFTTFLGGMPSSAAYIKANAGFSAANTPDYTWANDNATGIFHSATGKFAFTSQGWEMARIGSNTAPYQFYVLGNGFINNTWTSSDRRYKRNIMPLESSLKTILKLRGVSYEYNREEFKQMNFNEGKSMGLIAQEIQEILPEAVKADENGYLAVNYVSLIPLLIESIKEQQAQIEALKQNSNNSNSTGLENSANDAGSTLEKPVLYQNAPNPFNNVTVIKYYIPATAKNANIYIYDSNGNKKKSVGIGEKGAGDIKVAANELGQGIYFYSMVIDGKVEDSKTMLITD